MQKFKAILEIIGINPFIFVPEPVLNEIFNKAGKDKGHIPVYGTIEGKKFSQTLLKYRGEWRLYINTTMLKNSPRRIGEVIEVEIDFDPNERIITPHPELLKAIERNIEAKNVFHNLSPSKRKEIIRYIASLKN